MTEIPEMTLEELALEADLAQSIALAEKFQYEAERAKWEAKREELMYSHEQSEHDWQRDGVYSFYRKVNQKSADKLLRALSVWHHHDPERPWTIYLNSLGGSVYAGNSIIDELIAHSHRGGGTHHITVKVRGVALSMGGMILQAGDHRVMGPNSMLMIHRGSAGVTGTADDIADMAEWFRRDTDMMINYFLQRTDKVTRPEMLRKISRKDWYLYPDEALKLGFCDEIG